MRAKYRPPQSRSGFSLIEALIVIAIASILIIALTMFVGRSFVISRQQIEQTRITEEARIELERLSDTIRNAQYIDCNDDGDTSAATDHWLRAADEYDLTIYSNIDTDSEAEQVRYYLAGTELRQAVTNPASANPNARCNFPPGQTVERVLTTTVRNTSQAPPVSFLSYYRTNLDTSRATTPVADLTAIKRVRMRLVIDVTEAIFPPAASLETDVAPRAEGCSETTCGVLACTDPGTTSGSYDYDTSFAEAAFADCRDYCATNGSLPPGECCAWSAGFAKSSSSDDLVWATCQCASSYLPTTATDFPSPGGSEYTDFYRECLDGTRCAGQVGTPYCSAGCLSGQGECACVCPS